MELHSSAKQTDDRDITTCKKLFNQQLLKTDLDHAIDYEAVPISVTFYINL